LGWRSRLGVLSQRPRPETGRRRRRSGRRYSEPVLLCDLRAVGVRRAVHHAKHAKTAKRTATIPPLHCSVGACLRRLVRRRVRRRSRFTNVGGKLRRYRDLVLLCDLRDTGVRGTVGVPIDGITQSAPRSPRGPRRFHLSTVASELASDVRVSPSFPDPPRRTSTSHTRCDATTNLSFSARSARDGPSSRCSVGACLRRSGATRQRRTQWVRCALSAEPSVRASVEERVALTS
jgi:hypothetical protein